MKNKFPFFIYISLVMLFQSCNESRLSMNDQNILHAGIKELATQTKYSYESSKFKGLHSKELFDIIRVLNKEVEVFNRYDSTKFLVYKYLKKLKDVHYTNEIRYEEMCRNLDSFNTERYSAIENISFIGNFLTFTYWHNWECNYELIDNLKISFSVNDTLLLESNKKYKLKIHFDDKNPHDRYIINNSLQDINPNYIEFKTKRKTHHLTELKFETTSKNNITREKRKRTHQIYYYSK